MAQSVRPILRVVGHKNIIQKKENRMRNITYTVGIDGITPDGVQYGGIAGEHNATELIIQFDDGLSAVLATENGSVYYRIDTEDSAGAHIVGEQNLFEGETVHYKIAQGLTAAGGNATLRIIFTEIGDGGAERILYSFPIRLKFDDSFYGDEAEVKAVDEVCSLAAQVEKWVDEVELSKAEALGYRQGAEAASERAEEHSLAANEAKTGAQSAAQSAAKSAALAENVRAEVTQAVSAAALSAEQAETAKNAANEAIERADSAIEIAESASAEAAGYAEQAAGAAQSVTQSAEQAVTAVSLAESFASVAEVAAEAASEAVNNAEAAAWGTVKFTEQKLDTDQKKQARENIGAFPAAYVVGSGADFPEGGTIYNCAYTIKGVQESIKANAVTASKTQYLRDERQQQARINISADGGRWEKLFTVQGNGVKKEWEYGQFADGSALKLAAVAAVVYQANPEVTETNGVLYGYNGTTLLQKAEYETFLDATTVGGVAYGEIKQEKGYYTAFSVGMASGANQQINSAFMNFKYSTADYPCIDRVKISSGNVAMSAGNTITVWGVRYYE